MSGQHYLPQFLQRPFSFRTSGKDFYVRAYEKQRSFTPNTKGLGTEREFYGTVADERISGVEKELAAVVDELATSEHPRTTQSEYAFLTSCISLRTKAMRDALQSLSPMMIQAVRQFVEHKGFAKKQLQEVLSSANIDRLVSEGLAQHPKLNREQRAGLQRRVLDFKRNQTKLYVEIRSQALSVVMDGLDQLEKQAESIADRAFVKVLEQSASPAERLALFHKFKYSVLDAPADRHFILGDCGAVAVQVDGKPKLALGDIDETVGIASLYLPVSPTRCILGVRSGSRALSSPGEINVLSASLSARFFISDSIRDKYIEQLQLLIGSASPLITIEELDSMIESIEIG